MRSKCEEDTDTLILAIVSFALGIIIGKLI